MVYVYKAYRDDYAYGEEDIKVFANKDLALEHLKKEVEETFDTTWEEVPAKVGITEDDTFEPDYVSINRGDYTQFFIIEDQEVIGEN